MIDREQFLKAALPEAELDIPDVGTVRVRGLTRAEALGLQTIKDDPGALEQRIILLGLVEPALSADDVDAWYGSAPAGLTDLIVDAVSRLSGLGEGAAKSGVPGIRSG